MKSSNGVSGQVRSLVAQGAWAARSSSTRFISRFPAGRTSCHVQTHPPRHSAAEGCIPQPPRGLTLPRRRECHAARQGVADHLGELSSRFSLPDDGRQSHLRGLPDPVRLLPSRLGNKSAAAGCSDCRPARLVRQKPLGLFLRVRGVPPSPCRRGRAHQARRKPRDVSSHPADPHHKYGALARDGVS